MYRLGWRLMYAIWEHPIGAFYGAAAVFSFIAVLGAVVAVFFLDFSVLLLALFVLCIFLLALAGGFLGALLGVLAVPILRRFIQKLRTGDQER